MIQLSQNQTLVVAESIVIRVLSVQLDTVRLSVSTPPNLHIVPCQTNHGVTVRVTLIVIHDKTASLEVDTPCASIEQFCDELDGPDQLHKTWNFEFCTLHIGERVAFADISTHEATSAELE